MQCTGHKKNGEPCRALAVTGKTKCRMHGGTSTGRPITTGRHSKYQVVRLQARYEEALNDPELISVRDDIALAETFIQEALDQIGTDNERASWAKAAKLYNDYRSCSPDSAKAHDRLAELGALLEHGAEEEALRFRVLAIAEQKRKLAETEMDRLGKLQQFVTAQQLQAFAAQLLTLIRENVIDQGTRERIAAGVIQLVSG